MKNKWSIFVCLLITATSVVCQETKPFSFSLITTPLRLFNPNAPAIQLGTEIKIADNVSFLFEYGHQFSALSAEHIVDFYEKKYDWKYAVYSTEVKFLLPKKQPNKRYYISAQQFIIPQFYSKTSSWIIANDEILTYSRSRVEKHVIGFSFNTGLEAYFNKFTIEGFMGVGLKSISINHSLLNPTNNPVAISGNELKPWQDTIDRREGIFIRPHATIGLRFGFSPLR